MTLSTSSAVLEVLSAWHLWVWCSLTMCCRTWREASRPRSCGSASPWRWQPSPPENVPGLGLGFEEPHPAPTQSPELLLPWHWAGHIHAVWFCQGPCSLLCGLTHKHSTQAVQSAPTPSTYRDFLFLCVCLSTQSSEEKPGQLPALLHSGKTPCSRSIMVHVCNCGIKVYSFLFSSISALPFPPKMKTLTEIYHPPPSLHVQCFVVPFWMKPLGVAHFHAVTFPSRVVGAVRPHLPKACHYGSESLQRERKGQKVVIWEIILWLWVKIFQYFL